MSRLLQNAGQTTLTRRGWAQGGEACVVRRSVVLQFNTRLAEHKMRLEIGRLYLCDGVTLHFSSYDRLYGTAHLSLGPYELLFSRGT